MNWFWKCNFWNNSPSPFWGRWGQEVIFEVAEAKFVFHLVFRYFHLEFSSFMVFNEIWTLILIRPWWPQKGLGEFFQKLNFWNRYIPTKKMRYVTTFLSNFSLNLSIDIEEVCTSLQYFLCHSFLVEIFDKYLHRGVVCAQKP